MTLNVTPSAEARLGELKKKFDAQTEKPTKTGFTNCHIHTTYSFSPYSPSEAVWRAYQAGLATAGIMDHDSVSGAKEFIRAGEIVGLPVTVGIECRVRTDGTPLYGRRINNPDQLSVAYLAIHGIPHDMIDRVDEFIAPYREKRNIRNRKMCERINLITEKSGITLDFDRDVLPISMNREGGSVTERHLLFALTKKITALCPTPEEAVAFITDKLGVALSEKVKGQILLGRETPDFYEYDILGALKSGLVSKFYIDADGECPHITEFIALAEEIGAVSAYAYLGDVTDSVTGDKKAQKFEDDYLPLLMDTLKELGFRAVTYMPSRNTDAQLSRIMGLCRDYGFFEISGEDINSSRQSFICPALAKPECAHLAPAAFALIGHELAATEDVAKGMFRPDAIEKFPSLTDRVNYYSKLEF